jgi:hypothetical protein
MSSETQYNESLRILSIEITIIIPNRLMPKETEKFKQLITVKMDRFINFYERINQSFNYKNRKEINLNLLYIVLCIPICYLLF